MGIPVVVSQNGLGTPVRPVDANAPLMTVSANGLGMPIVISDLGAPFVVEGLFDPSALFSNGEQGAWPDPSDLTTMFQDAAGTVPVTADTQTVGLFLDKRLWGGKTLAQVLAGQPEKFGSQVPAIDNAGGSIGAYTAATKTCANTVTGTDSGYPRFTFDLGLTAGRYYSVTGKLTGDTSAVLLVQLATSGSASRPSYNPATGDIKGIVPASSQHFQLILNGTLGAKAVSITSLSIKEIPGNHASQATVAARRTYKTNGVLSWLWDDGSDDAMPVTFGNLGSNCTVAYATASGVTILTAQTISGVYNVPGKGANLYGCIIIDRALTPSETASVTAWLKKKAGL